ncbi:hypothetical protein C1646_777233 [Rhizophagus diaphanus]|nr:hypothetical protein C1646_777233 [Rhizophagus diaphanus] [Rhizophagus sp. MUCL 43196]
MIQQFCYSESSVNFDIAEDFSSDNTTNLLYKNNEEVNIFPIETNNEEVISNFINRKYQLKNL